MNLTFRDSPDTSETIVKGKFWTTPWKQGSDTLPEISIEERFAQRLGLGLGDELEFSVLGVPVKGRITSVRKIRWTTFQPNFFIQFQPGVLEYAPKTYVGAINKIDDLKLKGKIQSAIVEKFPNISIIDVSRLVKKITEIIDKMSWALSFMAILCLFAGLIVLFSICRQQVSARIWDISMLKVLGATFKDIRSSIAKEFFVISFLASTLGSSISVIASLILSKFVFEGVFAYNLMIPVALTASVTTLAVLVALQTSKKVLKVKPVRLLNN
jgi:putative ABC transport system permease protein